MNLLPLEMPRFSELAVSQEGRIVSLQERMGEEGHSSDSISETIEVMMRDIMMLSFKERMLFGDPEDEPLDFSI